ncbi:hypothetical protein Tco_0881875 [Tanacetum coccineum]
MSNDFNTTRVAQRKCVRPITHRSHKSKYSIHPGSDKIYQNLEKFYWLSSRGVMPPKRTSTSATPAMTHDAIRKLIAGITTALETQAAAMANADNPYRNTEPREIPEAKICNVTCITKVNELTQPTYGNPIYIYVKKTS